MSEGGRRCVAGAGLRAMIGVAAVGVLGLSTAPAGALGSVSKAGQQIPTGIQRIGATESRTADIDGIDDGRVDVDVALIDTGIDENHPDLNVVGGVNVYDVRKPNRWDDSDGHGTSVAGVIGALDNDEGVVGVAPGARLWSVKASTPRGHMNFISVLRGLEWVEDNADTIDVVNITAAFLIDNPGGAEDLRFREALNRVHDAGVTVVVPAGNNADDAGKYAPGAYEEPITVSAFSDTDGEPGGLGADDGPFQDDHFAAVMSNFGAAIDISAPGTAVRSTKRGGGYDVSDGTSLAAPHVAGVAALYSASTPGASPDQTRAALLAARERGPLPDDPDGIDEGVIRAERF